MTMGSLIKRTRDADNYTISVVATTEIMQGLPLFALGHLVSAYLLVWLGLGGIRVHAFPHIDRATHGKDR